MPALARGRGSVSLYAATLLVSAPLVFAVEPMFAKALLPAVGATPAVWALCVAFYSAALLGGYALAHGLAGRLAPPAQAAVYLAVLALGALGLPPAPDPAGPPDGGHPMLWLAGTLAVRLGPPFLALAITAPLLQTWFARATGRDPYPLYAASNLGSLLGLLGYPLLLEPALALPAQRRLWSMGYGLAGLLVAACAALVLSSRAPRAAVAAPAPVPRPAAREIAGWVLLAFVPSVLSLGVTGHITTDVAAAPLFWVVPLALYLVTFIVAFSRPGPAGDRLLRAQPILLLGAVLVLGLHRQPRLYLVPVHLASLFVTGLVCHRTLAARRPAPARLTEFYLWISVGGTLGALFAALAPVVFTSVAEYPLALALAAFCRPGTLVRPTGLGEGRRDLALALAPGAGLAGLWAIVGALGGPLGWSAGGPVLLVGSGLAALGCFALASGPRRFALGFAILVAATHAFARPPLERLHAERGFFGVLQVLRVDGLHVLMHGTTRHGAQSPARPDEPLAYYGRDSPIGQVFAAAPARRVAAVGLGAGALAAYGQAGGRITFYEIDPAVVRIARDPRLFSHLARSRAAVDLVVGDARLRLADAAAGAYDLVVLDAFSSDAVPTHLLTVEAMALYLSRLAPGGQLAFHTSNHFLDVRAAVAASARAHGLAGRVQSHAEPVADELRAGRHPSEWVVLARRPDDLGTLLRDPRWRPLDGPARAARPLTDDFSGLVGLLRWR